MQKLIFKYFFYGLSISILILIVIKAYLLSFTIDEALSYFEAKNINFIVNKSSNTHHLNSLWLFLGHFISLSELWLRLPNVMAFIIYALAVYRIIEKNDTASILLKVFAVIIIFNPLQIEFFSLARGYGLANALFLYALTYCMNLANLNNDFQIFWKNFFYYMTFFILALWTNFTVLNFGLIGLLIFLYVYWKNYKSIRFTTKQKGTLILFAIFLLAAMYKLYILKKARELYHGTNTFIEGIYLSIKIMTRTNENVILYATIGLVVLFVMWLVLFLYTRPKKLTYFSINMIILLGSVILTTIQGHIFGGRYPLDRTALPYFIQLGIVSYFGFYEYFQNHKVIQYILAILSITLIINHLSFYSLDKTRLWEFDSRTEKAIQYVRDIVRQNPSKKYTISNHWHFAFTINFYIDKYNLNLSYTDKSGTKEGTDFILEYANFTPSQRKYETVVEFREINTKLLKLSE